MIPVLRIFQSIKAELQSAFATPDPMRLAICVLPMPPQRIKQVKPKETPSDMYEIEVQKNKDGRAVSGVFGFHTATAVRRNEGSVPHLTEFDESELKARNHWGKEHLKAGRLTNINNAKAKAAWHDGADAEQIGKAVGLGTSWAEKRHSAFEAALKQENAG